jgi:hypothetical protein
MTFSDDFRLRASKNSLDSGEQVAPDEYQAARRSMVETQIRRRGINHPAVLEAMSAIPRHEFVPAEFRKRAYEDSPVPIGDGQTISQPYMVASMTVALGLSGTERVLEIGAGCGYQAAVLASLAKIVFTIEFRAELATCASQTWATPTCMSIAATALWVYPNSHPSMPSWCPPGPRLRLRPFSRNLPMGAGWYYPLEPWKIRSCSASTAPMIRFEQPCSNLVDSSRSSERTAGRNSRFDERRGARSLHHHPLVQ